MFALVCVYRAVVTSRLAAVLLIAAIAVSGFAAYSSTAMAAPPGAPVVNDCVITYMGGNVWRFAGTVSASAYEGMVVYLGGSVIDETDSSVSNGQYEVDVYCEPRLGDWVQVHAIDRFGMKSNTVSEDFPIF
jgi:hypothetical protein